VGLGDRAKARREVAEWQAQRIRLQSFLARARTFAGATNADGPTIPLPLLAAERALLVLPAVGLIEPPRLSGHFMGGNGGFTFPVARSSSDDVTPVDVGVVTVTDQRTVFSGSLHTRTWDHGAVIGYLCNAEPPWTAIAVSDRQRISGVRYDVAHADEFRFALALGLARYHDDEASLIDDLVRQLEDMDRERPQTAPGPDAVGASSPPVPTPATIPGVATTATGPAATPPPSTPPPVTAPSSAVTQPMAPTLPMAASWPAPATAAAQARVPASSPPTPEVEHARGSPVPPPGWYPDPYRTARLRWWDGHGWTSHAAP